MWALKVVTSTSLNFSFINYRSIYFRVRNFVIVTKSYLQDDLRLTKYKETFESLEVIIMSLTYS